VEKLCLVLALNLLWIVPQPVGPALAGGSADFATPIIINDPIPPLKQLEELVERDSVHQWLTFEINGTLSYEKGLDPRIPRILEYEEWVGYSISVGDTWFGLDFGDNKKLAQEAKKLLGKRVVVNGTLEERTLGIIPRPIRVLVVTELQEAAPAKEWIDLKVTGKLEARALPAPWKENRQGPDYLLVVLVNDKQYYLEIDAADLYAQALKLDGKRVVVSGRFDQTKDTPTIQAREVNAADDKAKDAIGMSVQGKLVRDAVKTLIQERGNLYRPYQTGWKVYVNGAALPVEFGDKSKLRDRAAKLDGQLVLVTGALETVEYIPLDSQPRPRPWDKDQLAIEPSFLKVPPMRTAQVLRASDLKAVATDSIQETVHLQIAGKLEHHVLESLPVQHVWLITVEGKTYRLRFGHDIPKNQRERLEGASVIITGTVEKDGAVLVTSLWPPVAIEAAV
jgi:hypothetical protein